MASRVGSGMDFATAAKTAGVDEVALSKPVLNLAIQTPKQISDELGRVWKINYPRIGNLQTMLGSIQTRCDTAFAMAKQAREEGVDTTRLCDDFRKYNEGRLQTLDKCLGDLKEIIALVNGAIADFRTRISHFEGTRADTTDLRGFLAEAETQRVGMQAASRTMDAALPTVKASYERAMIETDPEAVAKRDAEAAEAASTAAHSATSDVEPPVAGAGVRGWIGSWFSGGPKPVSGASGAGGEPVAVASGKEARVG